MTHARRARSGFGLIELLMAMAILGIVLAAILALTSGTTRFTLRSTLSSDAARDLSDASGYLGDAFRSSNSADTDIPVVLVGGAGSFTCEEDLCVAFASPTFNALTGDAEGEVLSVYRVLARSEIPASWRIDSPYTGDNATSYALVRYTSAPGASQVGATPSLVLDNVVLADTNLEYDNVSGTLEIAVRVGRTLRGDATLLPGDGPLVTRVVRRN